MPFTLNSNGKSALNAMRFAPNRLILFGFVAFACVGLIAISLAGLLRPVQSVISIPLNLLQQGASGVSHKISGIMSDLADLQSLKERNAELERALVSFQAEIVDLREIKADYQQLVKLLNYRDSTSGRQYLPARVIGRDTSGLLRTITIDHGTRDGLAVGMPVVSDLGLVGRIYQVSANAAQILLVTDPNSFVNSAMLQSSRTIGLVQGTASGGLQMLNIKLTDTVNNVDSVVTSGIGGKFPRGILIGQLSSVTIDDSRLFQRAQIHSLVPFDRLEIVLVITNFEPIQDFATPGASTGQ